MGCVHSKTKEEVGKMTPLPEGPVKTVDTRLPFTQYRQVFTLKNSWKSVSRKLERTALNCLVHFFQTTDHGKHYKKFSKLQTESEMRESEDFQDMATQYFEFFDEVLEFATEDKVDFAIDSIKSRARIHSRIPDFSSEFFKDLKPSFLKAVSRALEDRFTDTTEENFSVMFDWIINLLEEEILKMRPDPPKAIAQTSPTSNTQQILTSDTQQILTSDTQLTLTSDTQLTPTSDTVQTPDTPLVAQIENNASTLNDAVKKISPEDSIQSRAEAETAQCTTSAEIPLEDTSQPAALNEETESASSDEKQKLDASDNVTESTTEAQCMSDNTGTVDSSQKSHPPLQQPQVAHSETTGNTDAAAISHSQDSTNSNPKPGPYNTETVSKLNGIETSEACDVCAENEQAMDKCLCNTQATETVLGDVLSQQIATAEHGESDGTHKNLEENTARPISPKSVSIQLSCSELEGTELSLATTHTGTTTAYGTQPSSLESPQASLALDEESAN